MADPTTFHRPNLRKPVATMLRRRATETNSPARAEALRLCADRVESGSMSPLDATRFGAHNTRNAIPPCLIWWSRGADQ